MVASDFLRHPHYLRHFGHGVHANDVRAGEHRGRHRRGRAPVSFRRRPAADRISQKRLA
jgi:hypothetical protein